MAPGPRSASVDPELCVGSGDCVRAVPEAFQLDEALSRSVPQPEGVRSVALERLVRAARQCPMSAIRVVGDDGEVLVESA